jgi:hypothetical protein
MNISRLLGATMVAGPPEDEAHGRPGGAGDAAATPGRGASPRPEPGERVQGAVRGRNS